MLKPKYITRLELIPGLYGFERIRLQSVVNKYSFRANDYYLSLIDWRDPADPIRRLIIPDVRELEEWGELDPSNEEEYTVAPGTQHKYRGTVLLLINDICGGYCRFCFRKRLFMNENDEVTRDITEGLEYIRNNDEINNVVLTGGDPLLMSTAKLENTISALREIDHVRIIRIGSKMPAFNPFRIINDPSLTEMLAEYGRDNKKIYLMAHFNHPRELTDYALKAINMLLEAGVIIANQTPLLRGINDDPEVLTELFNKLSYIGVPPYYLFQMRPTSGNKMYSLPIEESVEIFDEAIKNCSGLAKRARLTMSHSTGKIEILGLDDMNIFFKYHRAADHDDFGRILVFKRNPDAYWLDDYSEVEEEIIASQSRGW